MPRTPGVQGSQAKDMYWFAHGGIESAMNQRHPVRSTTPGPGDTEDDSSESGSLSLKVNSERRAASEEPVPLKQSSCDQQDSAPNAAQRLNFNDKRQAVEERKRLLLEAEQEKNDAILKKHIEREAAFEARRNAQRSNISFAFGSTVARQSEVDGGGRVASSPELDKPKLSPPTTLYTLPPKTDFSETVEFSNWKPKFPQSCLTGSGLIFADVMSQSMFSPTSSARGRRKNDLTPTIPYDRAGPPRTAPPTRKRSVSMSRLDQLAQPRKAYVEAQKANSTISNSSSKEARHSPTRPLSVASEKLSGASKASSNVTRRPTTAARKPRPVSIAGTHPDHVPQLEKIPSKNISQTRKSDAPVGNVKTHTSHLRTRAKSSSSERKAKPPKPVAEKSTPPKVPSSPPKPRKSTASKPSVKHSTPKQSTTPKLSSSPKQWTPKTSPARKLLTNKKQAAILVSTTTEGALDTSGEAVMLPSSPARSNTPDEDSQSADERSSGKRIISEEEAKASLAEKRRLAREQAEKEAELERQRQEQLEKEEEERLRLEEEEQRRMEEEQLSLQEEHRRFEEEKLRKAIEEQERKEEEEKAKREEEARIKAEQEKKAKEEAEKQRIELEEKLKKEEEERAERKKRLEKIMSRTRGKSGTASPGSGSEAPDSTESQPEVLSSEPNSLDSNIAVESLPMDNPHPEEPSASESYDYNQTMNLDSHSLSSNDLMMPSSGHTSLDGSIPIAASEHASLEVQQTSLQAKGLVTKADEGVAESEGEEVSSSSTQPVTELPLEKSFSNNTALTMAAIDPTVELISKDTPSVYDHDMKISVEDDTLVSGVHIDASWHADEDQILHDENPQGEFSSSFVNENRVVDSEDFGSLKDPKQNVAGDSKTSELVQTSHTSESGAIEIEEVLCGDPINVDCVDSIKTEDNFSSYVIEETNKVHTEDDADFNQNTLQNTVVGSQDTNIIFDDSKLVLVEDTHPADFPVAEMSEHQTDAGIPLKADQQSSDDVLSVSKDQKLHAGNVEEVPELEGLVADGRDEDLAKSEADPPDFNSETHLIDSESAHPVSANEFINDTIGDDLVAAPAKADESLTAESEIHADQLKQDTSIEEPVLVATNVESFASNPAEITQSTPGEMFSVDTDATHLLHYVENVDVFSGSNDHIQESLAADQFGQRSAEQSPMHSPIPEQAAASTIEQMDEPILLPDPISESSSLPKDLQAESFSPSDAIVSKSSPSPDFDNEAKLVDPHVLNLDPNVVAEMPSPVNPFASDTLNFSSQPFESDHAVEESSGLERFADHGVLKTVDEMNVTNLEETNKNAGLLFANTEEVPVDAVFGSQRFEANVSELPLDLQQNLPGQTLPQDATDQSYRGMNVNMPLLAPDFDSDADRNLMAVPEEVPVVFEDESAQKVDTDLAQRTLNPFGDVGFDPVPAEGGFLSPTVISKQVFSEESNLANELLMNALNSAIDESEDSSLDSNLSQVLNVDATESTATSKLGDTDSAQSKFGVLDSSPSETERSTCDIQQISNSAMQHEDLFISKTNGFNTTYNNGCLYGDRFESAEFKADQIPVLPRDLDQSLCSISENGTNANISTVGNGNTLDNLDNVNSNKIASNPFLISSSDTHSFPANPFELNDDKTVPTL